MKTTLQTFEQAESELPEWLGFGAKFARANLEVPHDMESVRASIAKKRSASSID